MSDELDELFGGGLDLEGQHIEKGRVDGVADGCILGKTEGWESGVRSGFTVGGEVGFYSGCAQVWQHYADQHPDLFSERAQKGIAALQRLVASFPLDNAEDDSLQDVLEKLRSKFKAVSSMLGVHQEYSPKENPSSLSF
mmetsp:Transcript_39995/g.76492  ORF Transcript_39995/g.76492 Transcript_39995/m.76492 type:complete len:139 (+) Transcript_39995:225-641(+)